MTIQTPLVPALWTTERKMRFLAKELAVDIVEPAKICELMEIDVDEWDQIIQHPQFRIMLQEEKERWNSSLNIKERVDLKTWAIIEDALLQFQQYLHSPTFNDNAKVALYAAMQKQVGIGQRETSVGEVGQRVEININYGGEKPLVIDGEVTPKGNLIEQAA
jgi:hypothetical protein